MSEIKNAKDMLIELSKVNKPIVLPTPADLEKQLNDYIDKWYKSLSFWRKVQYRLISLWGWIEFFYQIFMYRVFKVDWHKNDEDEWEDE